MTLSQEAATTTTSQHPRVISSQNVNALVTGSCSCVEDTMVDLLILRKFWRLARPLRTLRAVDTFGSRRSQRLTSLSETPHGHAALRDLLRCDGTCKGGKKITGS